MIEEVARKVSWNTERTRNAQGNQGTSTIEGRGNPSVPKGQTSTLQLADKSGEGTRETGKRGNHCTGVYR